MKALQRSRLYAPRLIGDMDLGIENSRVRTTHLANNERDWSRIITPGGRLPGGSEQSIYEESATQNYRIGTRLVQDERVFRYTYAQEDLIKMMGAYNHSQWPINAALLTQATAGQWTITVPENACAQDDYAGGWIVMFTAPMQMRRILGNDASDGTEAVLYLDGPWEGTGIIGTWVTGYTSMWRNVRCPPAPAPDYISFVCIPLIMVTSGYYFWGQTWGPCYSVADGTVPGSTPNARDVYFATSGNLLAAGVPPGFAAYGMQRAGYLIPRTSFGAGDQLFMLELQP
jgi:hypothetical protein